MTPENHPVPGSPEWLRQMADSLADEASMPEGSTQALREAAGLRAAAERIEALEEELEANEQLSIRQFNLICGEVARLRAENEAIKKAGDHWEQAVRRCVEWSNGREYEWGSRAENAFAFLHAAIDAARKEAP
jgi:hypothetical protein